MLNIANNLLYKSKDKLYEKSMIITNDTEAVYFQ